MTTLSPRLLRRAAEATLRHQGVPTNVALTLYLSDDPHIQQLNRTYLGIDAPTDVLSFPADEFDPQEGRHYLGDVILSLSRAQEQAQRAGHPLEAEVQLLVVHGVLHLLGHDHAEAEEKARMWQAQQEILNTLGWPKLTVLEE